MREREFDKFLLRQCAGNSGFEVKQAFVFPGEWYYERVSKNVSRGPFQRPPKTYYLCVGFAKLE